VKATSFVNEHSVEYVLVNHLVAMLSQEHRSLIPIFFWKTREGSRTATQGMLGQHVRLLTVFARRPKVLQPFAQTVLMKVNSTLFDAAGAATDYGSPVLAGIPRSSSLLNFTFDVACSWFRLLPGHCGANADVEISVSVDGSVTTGVVAPVEGPLDTREILRIARLDATSMSWDKAVEAIIEIRRSSTTDGYWRFRGTGYRPFFLLIPS